MTNISPVNSYSVFSGMGYKAPATGTQPLAARNSGPSNQANLQAQNMVLKINNEEMNMNINIPNLDADLIDKTPNDPLNFKDMTSFSMNVNRGILKLSDRDLSSTVTSTVTKDTDLIKNIDIQFQPGNRVKTQLDLKKSFLKLKVKVEGSISANPINNMLRLTPDKIKVANIPVHGLLKLLHLEVGELVKIGKPTGSFFTSGDSIYFSPTKLVDNPTINGNVTDVKTEIGAISILIGKEASLYKPSPLYGSDNYLHLQGGNVDFSGFNLKDADVALLDGTPNDPFDIEGDPSKKVITKGQVSIPEEFIATALKNKAGDGSSMKNMRFSMPGGVGKLKASMWGFLPISLDLNFGKSSGGELKVTPDKGKVLGFIPLPDSLLRKTLQKETEGKIDGNGVTVDLDKLADLQTPALSKVSTSNGQLILTI